MRRSPFLETLTAAIAVCLVVSCGPGTTPGLEQLRDDAQRVRITDNPLTGTPSFVRTLVPLNDLGLAGTNRNLALGFLGRYANLFGLGSPRSELQYVGEQTDALGMRHVTLEQVYRGVDVYGARMTVHLSRNGEQVLAVTSSAIPHLSVPSVRSRIDADVALQVARRLMPEGVLVSSELVIYPGHLRQSAATLVWLVELRDDNIPSRRAYAVNARNGRVIDVLDRLYVARNRQTHTANHEFKLPGTLRRGEADAAVGDSEVDKAHDFAGETYDYFSNTHNRDSYDNLGATLSSTAHYRVDFQNAFWNGVQMVYGDGYAVKDVAAHEMTHAVTEYAAKLEYRWQSGALNESFSDIFAAMVDRDDWLIGEDLPNGPIRNMQDPTQFNHPGHTDDWRGMCGDNEGVHINSGIHNKAYVNVAEAIGKDRAEQIFYRALTVYLGTQSSFEDARSAALQSATDLFGEGGAPFKAVDAGFADVGIDGSFDPGPGGCAGSSTDDSLDDTHTLLESLLTALAIVLGVAGLFYTMRRR